MLTGNCSLRGHSGARYTKSILAQRSVFPGQMCFIRDGRASHFSRVLTRWLQVSCGHVVSDTVITGSSMFSPPYGDITSIKPDQSCLARGENVFISCFLLSSWWSDQVKSVEVKTLIINQLPVRYNCQQQLSKGK